MNLNQLKYFHAVCTFKSLSLASEHLYISQPSLSNSLKALENEFGVTLFKRHHHGMELTNEGKLLFNMCTGFLENLRQIENTMNSLGKNKNTIRLGVPPMIGYLLLPCIYGEFLKENPEINIHITEGGRHELLEKLSNDYLDIAILPHSRNFENTFSSQSITELEIACCVSKDNPLSQLKKLSPSHFKETPVILFNNNFFQTEEIKKWFASENITPDILLQTDQLSTMLNMVSNNISAGFAFKDLISESSELCAISLEKPLFVNISLVRKNDSFSFNALSKLKDYLKSKLSD